MQKITLNGSKAIIVDVPDGTEIENIIIWNSMLTDNCDGDGFMPFQLLPEGNWSILGTLTDGIPDFDVMEYVESWDSPTGGGDVQDYYKNYTAETPENCFFLTDFTEPEPSFTSLLKSQGVDTKGKKIIIIEQWK